MEEKLRWFGAGIGRLVCGEDLSRAETYDMFAAVLQGEQPDLQQGAFLAALVAKGETAAEIAGAWEAIDNIDTLHTQQLDDQLVENSGTGMDTIKTFNVSSAAAIVAAACGAKMARHGSRALTSVCGTVDVLEACGIAVEQTVEEVRQDIERCGIGLFNGMSAEVHPGALSRILSQVRFGSTLNLAASLANPARPSRGVRGVYAQRLVSLTREVMQEIGYTNGMVVYGRDALTGRGMDELSVCGPTEIERFSDAGVHRSHMQPSDVGLQTWPVTEIAALVDCRAEAERMQSVLAGKGPQACEDFCVLNAAAVLEVAGICETLRDGVAIARSAIRNGAAMRKLEQWRGRGERGERPEGRSAFALRATVDKGARATGERSPISVANCLSP